MSRPFKLSKSRLLAFRQCPKRLWLQTYRSELAELDATASAVMASLIDTVSCVNRCLITA